MKLNNIVWTMSCTVVVVVVVFHVLISKAIMTTEFDDSSTILEILDVLSIRNPVVIFGKFKSSNIHMQAKLFQTKQLQFTTFAKLEEVDLLLYKNCDFATIISAAEESHFTVG
jgi:hypothetical protein